MKSNKNKSSYTYLFISDKLIGQIVNKLSQVKTQIHISYKFAHINYHLSDQCMLPSNQDKKMLIESMKKLTNHISNNYSRQKDIFQSLSKLDIMKIFNNLNDENQYLRRISGLLLTELLYNNNEIRSKVVKMLQIYPSFGRICLNGIPEAIQKYPSTFKKCIQLIKSPLKKGEQQKMCWTINLDRKVLQIQYLQYKKYSSFTFLDPNKNIFGITFLQTLNQTPIIQSQIGSQSHRSKRSYVTNYNINKINQSSIPSPRPIRQLFGSRQIALKQLKQNKQESANKNYNHKNTERQKSSQSQRSNHSKKEGLSFSHNSFYKNYIDARNRLKDSPGTYKQTYQKKQQQRPNTSRSHKQQPVLNLNLNLNQNKNQNKSFRQQDLSQSFDYYKSSHSNNNSNNINVSTKNRQKLAQSQPYPHSYTQIINNESQAYNNSSSNPYPNSKTMLITPTKFKQKQKQKVNFFHDSIPIKQQFSTIRGSNSNTFNKDDSSLDYKDKGRGLNTQRKAYQPNSQRYKISDSLIMGNNSSKLNSSGEDRHKIPDTAKNSYTSQHQKFYKRVKEILKK